MKRVWTCLGLATLTVLAGGCPRVSTKKQVPKDQIAVAKDATREELIEKFNALAGNTKSLNATVDLRPTAGSKYSGLIEEYHEVRAFLLAKRPANIRMIGQAPVVAKTIFDMTSDGETFRVSLPTKNKFLVGEVGVERNSAKPLENLRPQHLLDALLWPEIVKGEAVLFEEFNDENARYYVLTVLRGGYTTEIRRKIWFDRSDLSIARVQNYGPKGVLLSDAHYSQWEPVPVSDGAADTSSAYPRSVRIDRPHDDYRIDLQITKLSLNEDLPADRFQLAQPPNSEVVHVGQDKDAPPAKDSKP
jgi:outer membrane lipoprotein-sorting protein